MKRIHQIREMSTLSFNERVLQEAEDRRNPLMERLRFLGIFSSNMDEFFKVRAASVQRRIELGEKHMAGLMEVIGEKSRELDERFQEVYETITASLRGEGVELLTENAAAVRSGDLHAWLREHFRERILPSLVPIIVRKKHPFPQLNDGALYLGIRMRGAKTRFAILEIPANLPRFVELPNGNMMYVDDVIRLSLDDIFYLFPYERIDAFEFKISRDAELDIDNDFSEGHVRKMEKVLKQRSGGRPTRLVYDASMPKAMLHLLRKGLELNEDDTLIGGGRYHNMRDLMRFPNQRSHLAFDRAHPAPHPVLDGARAPMLEVMRRQDLLITYPYQAFDHVIRLLREAAIDPKVDSIQMTMYRAAPGSQVANALINAARNGKRVFVSVELQARFDEANNIRIAERLNEAGATVVYGVPPMKTHAKLLLIDRGKERFAGLSTGNFNEITGRIYVDSILLTAEKSITSDVARVFRFLDQAAKLRTLETPSFKQLLVSPFNARASLLELLERERTKGATGRVFLKVNHLTDPQVIEAIRQAADAGVQVNLIARTTYAMLPHERIRAISILDRYLEHQRVYAFGEGEDLRLFMSSADLMERNLDNRVEAAFPIQDPALRQQVLDIMAIQLADSAKARILDETQSNPYVSSKAKALRAQEETQRYFQRLAGAAAE